MGLRPTHGDESALLRFIDSKQVTRDFRGSVNRSRIKSNASPHPKRRYPSRRSVLEDRHPRHGEEFGKIRDLAVGPLPTRPSDAHARPGIFLEDESAFCNWDSWGMPNRS